MTATSPFHVALLVEMSSAHGRGMIRGVGECVRKNPGLSLHHEECGPLTETPRWFESWRGHGVIARIENDEIAKRVLAKGQAVVNVSGRSGPDGIPHVDTDNRGVAELAVEYFVKREFRNFAYFGTSDREWSGWRQQAFEQSLAAIRVVPQVFLRDNSLRSPERLRDWLSSLPTPTALLACNDLHAMMVLEACREAGISVPDRIAVLGVDNDDILCTLSNPQLSSIAPDAETIGYLAASTLHRQLLGEVGLPQEQWIAPLLLHSRESTDSAATEDWLVRQALRFIHGNAVRDIGVGEVVGHTGASRRCVEQRFRRVLGRPIHEEIQRVRIAEGQRLLTGTTLALKDVALRSGFKKADYLSAVFREKVGVSPSEYRNGLR